MPSCTYTEPRQQLGTFSVFSLAFPTSHATQSTSPGGWDCAWHQRFTEPFCCARRGCDKRQIVKAGAVLSAAARQRAKARAPCAEFKRGTGITWAGGRDDS